MPLLVGCLRIDQGRHFSHLLLPSEPLRIAPFLLVKGYVKWRIIGRLMALLSICL